MKIVTIKMENGDIMKGEPVSYTHLDVYKRQAHGIAAAFFNRDFDRLILPAELKGIVDKIGKDLLHTLGICFNSEIVRTLQIDSISVMFHQQLV